MYYFECLNYFLLLIPIFLFTVFLYFKGGKNIVFGDTKILNKVFKNNSFYYKIYYLLLLFVFIVYLSIFSNLIIKEEKTKIAENGIDIQLVLDVSYSMLAEDFLPNRLESSKKIIGIFLDELSGDRLGLIVFAGRPFTALPLNFDYPISNKIIKNISVDIIDQNNSRMQGTAIGDALIIASEGFDDNSVTREKIIILLTDGDANVGVDPELAIKFLKEDKKTKDIKVYTIGIGGDKEAQIRTKDVFGREVLSKVGGLNEEALKNISKSTGGKYFRASDEQTLDNIFETISKLERKEFEREKLTIKKEKNIYLVYLLIIFFIGLFILKYKKNI